MSDSFSKKEDPDWHCNYPHTPFLEAVVYNDLNILRCEINRGDGRCTRKILVVAEDGQPIFENSVLRPKGDLNDKRSGFGDSSMIL